MPNKHVFIVHGWEATPESDWFPWLRRELEKREFAVSVPAMPDTMSPKREAWVSHLAKTVGVFDENCYFVGHSLGCITILRYLETLQEDQVIGGAVLVGGFGTDLEYPDYKGEISSFFSTPLDWGKIKKHCPQFVAIHSDDDPWVPIKHSQIFREKLGAKAIVVPEMKHLNAEAGLTELPLVLDELLKISG